MVAKERSPFTPGSPVSAELFVGRTEQIEEIVRHAEQAAHGKQENIFLSGDRGIGKSSLAAFVKNLVVTQKDMLGVHVSLGRVSTLEEMVRHIFDQVLKEVKGQKLFEDVKGLFGKYVTEVGLFGISVSFSPPEQHLRELVRKFPEALKHLVDKIVREKKGLVLILDDINGFAEKAEFAAWYKSFADEVATHYDKFPVLMILIGLPERRDSLARLEPSLMRIFRVVEVFKLDSDEVKKFYTAAFKSVDIAPNPNALDNMGFFSGGLPLLMHEIGDAAFWVDRDGVLDEREALDAIFDAAQKVGIKYLDPKVYHAIRSDSYRSILKKLGKYLDDNGLEPFFPKKDIDALLTITERRVFHNFLRRMTQLGVIQRDIEGGVGSYCFANALYPIYIAMMSGGPELGAE